MLRGRFIGDIPIINVTIAWGTGVQTSTFILDTGFSGDLQVTPQIAVELGLQSLGVTPIQIANGQVVSVQTALAIAAMEGSNAFVQVLISNGSPLAGISLLTKFGYKATVDCKYRTIELERVP